MIRVRSRETKDVKFDLEWSELTAGIKEEVVVAAVFGVVIKGEPWVGELEKVDIGYGLYK